MKILLLLTAMWKYRKLAFTISSIILLVILGYLAIDSTRRSEKLFFKYLDVKYKLDALETKFRKGFEQNEFLYNRLKKSLKEYVGEERIKQIAEKVKYLEEKEKLLAVSESNRLAIAVLVIACNRVTVIRCLEQILKYRPSPQEFPVIVSQDGHHKPTARAIQIYGNQVFHINQPDQSEIHITKKEIYLKGYYKIARHYGWALNQTFIVFNFSTAIIIEDDLDISPDIFEYFKGTLPLLHLDPTLWCISAWNDNGKLNLTNSDASYLLHRTDFFPGLGWMVTKSKWFEIFAKWPPSYWDDWLRKPEQRKGRAYIRPEISRTKTFGIKGVSNGEYYDNHLKHIYLNTKFVPFTKMNLSYLLKDNYDHKFAKDVHESPVVSWQELKLNVNIVTNGSVKILYYNQKTFRKAAQMFGLMDDLRSGIPRNAYRGVVSFFYNMRRVYLAPIQKWKAYNTAWT